MAAPRRTNAVQYGEVMDALGGQAAFLKALNVDSGDYEEKRRAFLADVALMRKRFGEMTKFLLKPNSLFVERWDMVTSVALLFTTFVTPFEVGLGLETKVDGLFVINQLVNCIFIFDIGIQFFMPVLDKNGQYIREHKKIAAKYMKGWFPLDVFSVLPFDILVVADALSGPDPSLLRGVRLLRVLRLVKLARILRASRIITR